MAKRRTDWGSLIAGLLFLGLAVAFVVRGTGDWEFNVVWVLPVLAAGLIAAGVVRALTRSRGNRPLPEHQPDPGE
jgi:peptidoglycan/LPS O-acetylase OafA/YrhL